MVTLGPVNVSKGSAAAMGISVDWNPSPLLLVAAFNKLGADIRSFREPLKRSIQEVVAPSIVKNFKVQGRPEMWEEVAQGTWEQKVDKGFASVASFPLIRTRKLSRKAGQLNIWNIDGLEGIATMSLPSDVWYGAIHQDGSEGDGSGPSLERRRSRVTGKIVETERRARGSVPQRVWAIIQDEDVAEIEKVFDKWLGERVRANLAGV